MLRDYNRGAEVLVQPAQEPDELVARDRVELGCRLVEEQQPRPVDHRGGDRHTLELTARERVRAALEQMGDPELERRLLDRARDRAGGLTPVLERQLELGTHAPHHDLRLGLLEDRAAHRGELSGAVRAHVELAHAQLARRLAAVEVRDETAERAQQRRLAGARDAAEHGEGAGGDRERDMVERRPRRIGIAVAELPGGSERHGAPPTPSRAARPANGASASRTIAALSAQTAPPQANSRVGYG
jgi:hypothetical protein